MVQSISSNNLKIVLSAEEVNRLFGGGTIDFKNEKTGKIMDKILNHAAKALHFEPSSKKVIVEIFKKKNGSCIIYFLDVCQKTKKEAVLEFGNVDDLITAVEQFKNCDWSVYLYNGVYRIITEIDALGEEMIKRMCEFSKIYFEKEQVAKTLEYGVEKFKVP